MEADDIDRVRSSFDRVWPISTHTVELFYMHLFDMAPELRSFFRDDIDEQKRKFLSTLAVIVASFDDTRRLGSLLATLGRQHGESGVQPAHYAIVGDALLWSLEQALGREWTPCVATSWRKAYGLISQLMLEHSDHE